MANIKMTKSMASVFTSGPTVKCMKVTGNMASNMDKANSRMLKVNRGLENGMKANVFVGWRKMSRNFPEN